MSCRKSAADLTMLSVVTVTMASVYLDCVSSAERRSGGEERSGGGGEEAGEDDDGVSQLDLLRLEWEIERETLEEALATTRQQLQEQHSEGVRLQYRAPVQGSGVWLQYRGQGYGSCTGLQYRGQGKTPRQRLGLTLPNKSGT